jgi:hypothetical protein
MAAIKCPINLDDDNLCPLMWCVYQVVSLD